MVAGRLVLKAHRRLYHSTQGSSTFYDLYREKRRRSGSRQAGRYLMETMANMRSRSELSVSRTIISAERSLSTSGCMFIFEYEMPSPVLPAAPASQHPS